MLPTPHTYLCLRVRAVGLLVACLLFFAVSAWADLRINPTWFDTNGTGIQPDWHYRVPIAIPAGTPVNSTIRVDVDFDLLLSALGISGTFDSNSPRVVQRNGALADLQQFTDAVFMDATDGVANARGEVCFIHQDAGSDLYHLYFDITQNGVKPAWPAADTINGNFEFGATGDRNVAGWNVTAAAGFDAQLRPSETPSIYSDTTGADTPPVITDGTPRSGRFSYLLGARSQNEPGDANPAVTLARTIDVPASNPGELSLRYRVEGWDSSADAANQYDFIRIRLAGSSTVELVGPGAGNYGLFPYAPNYGTQPVSTTQSGYGQYNGWDTDTTGGHHYTPPMTLMPGSQPWFQITASLAGFAGQTVTLEITSSHINRYRSWVHVDDVHWSLVAGSLGTPQAFGANGTNPLSAAVGSNLLIAAVVDAQPLTVVADIRDDTDAVAASGIVLFDDGSHGDLAPNDGLWTNDGSDSASPTFTIPAGATVGTQWTTVLYALDGSSSLVSPTDGLVHIQGQGTAQNQANFYNIDEQPFTILAPVADLSTSTKSVVDMNGGSLYPGDVLRYTITLIESAGIVAAQDVRVIDAIPAHVTGFTLVSMPTGAVDASTPHGSGPNGTGLLDVSGIHVPAGGTEFVVFDVTVANTAATGAGIDNTAVITASNGIGASPSVTSPPVNAAPAAGNKPVYLRTTSELSRIPPAVQANRRIGRNRSHQWTLAPVLQQPLTFRAGAVSVPVRLMMRHARSSVGDRATQIHISISGVGSQSNIPITVNGTVQAYTFSIPITSPAPVTLAPGSAPVMTIGATDQAIRVYTMSGGTPSRLLFDVDTVINVDAVAFYDAAYPAGTVIASARPGDTVFIRAVVSDPFGSFDIAGAGVAISGPAGSSSHVMTEVLNDGAASKIYEYSLTLPAIGSDGPWVAVVTAVEGTEGTITHQGTASLLVGSPLLTILKSASSATAAPGDLITYTVQVVNTGTAAAVNIELDDAMSPYTALRIAFNGSDPLPFALVSAPGGFTFGTPAYSDDGGATYGYGPLVSGGGGASAGHDANVSHWRLPMTGALSGNGDRFTMQYQVMVE